MENDDRAMYKVNPNLIKEEISQCPKSALVENAKASDLKRMLTYGEVLPDAFTETILPFLALETSDVFYDLGCGTGKIVVQVALETHIRNANGIELMQNRVLEGERALKRLVTAYPEELVYKHIRIVQGDICHPPSDLNLMDATVIFINNVLFPPELMFAVCELLGRMKSLKRIVTTKKICDRHRDLRCARLNSMCVLFDHPPASAKVAVSWAKHAHAYLYTIRMS